MSTDLDGGNAFEMSTVIGRYKDYLNEQHMSLNSYTTQRLKLRLNKHFGDKIVFHQPYDRTKSELLYSPAISLQDVINSAYKCNAAAIECLANSPHLRWRTATELPSAVVASHGVGRQIGQK